MRPPARDTILDAAERLLADYGYQKITMEEVAREAGVGRTTIYLHFKTKEEVALAVLDRVHGRLLDRLRAIARRAADAPAERVRGLLRTRIDFALTEARVRRGRGYDELYAAIRPAYMARRDQFLENEAGVLAGVLEEGRTSGEFRFAGAPGSAALALVFATNGLMPYSLSPRYLDERGAVLERADIVIEFLLSGLRSRA